MMKSKELKIKISHTHSLILSLDASMISPSEYTVCSAYPTQTLALTVLLPMLILGTVITRAKTRLHLITTRLRKAQLTRHLLGTSLCCWLTLCLADCLAGLLSDFVTVSESERAMVGVRKEKEKEEETEREEDRRFDYPLQVHERMSHRTGAKRCL